MKSSEDYRLYKQIESAPFSSFLEQLNIHPGSYYTICLYINLSPTRCIFLLYFLPISVCHLPSSPPLSPHLSISPIYHPPCSIAGHEKKTRLLAHMLSLHYAAGLAGILFSLLQTTSALPTSDPTTAPSNLFSRALDKYVDCSDEQKTKLGQGFADAATLARWTFDHPISLGHTAYVLPCLLIQSEE